MNGADFSQPERVTEYDVTFGHLYVAC